MKTKELLKIAVNSRFCRVLASVSGHILLAADRRRTYIFPGIPYLYGVFSVWCLFCMVSYLYRKNRAYLLSGNTPYPYHDASLCIPIHTMMHPYMYLSMPWSISIHTDSCHDIHHNLIHKPPLWPPPAALPSHPHPPSQSPAAARTVWYWLLRW